jgi:2-oxoglutarate ferredoxin oxidoreductase subunit delta
VNRVTVNTAWCKQCGICIEFCPARVFEEEIDGTPLPGHADRCTGCRICVLRCPDFAIEVEVEEYGR